LKTKTKTKLQRNPEELTITISRTVQAKQYEPVTVTITERHKLEEGENIANVRLEVYNQIAPSLARYMDKELARYTEE
jgi:hypothetical protein